MKTDQDLKADVVAELMWDDKVNPTSIGVSVKDGIVSLSGQVETYIQKKAVEAAVHRVSGVRGIAVDLEVALSTSHQRSDADIAKAAVNALRWHSLVPDDKVQVKVEDGWITLSGELDFAYQSQSAEHTVRPLVGVKGVINQIELKPNANAAVLKSEIAAAFERHARRDAKRIQVDVDGSTVTLKGDVDSMAEHDAALGTARATRGVTRVVDCLRVTA